MSDKGSEERRPQGTKKPVGPMLPASLEMEERMRRVVRFLVAAALPLGAQTQVDLHTQSKNVDFREAGSTKPFKTGTYLPAGCVVGEMFFKTDAPVGNNLYGCVSANTWQLESSSPGQGVVTVENGGVVVGTREVQNFVPGAGFVYTMTDTGQRINIQQAIDTAVMQTQANAQSGAGLLCVSASGSASAYTCAMNPALTAYSPGMVLLWKPDVNASAGAITLNVDTLGAKSVKLANGSTDPAAADLEAGNLYPVWYDGSSFRLMIQPLNAGVAAASRPDCGASLRGRIWQTFGGTGAKDEVAVCAKDNGDAYAWRVLY
jgi:hypothetical protein